MQFRIFCCTHEAHRDSTELQFVTAFSDQEATAKYVRYLFGKRNTKGKEIVYNQVEAYGVNASEGVLDGLIFPLGEEIPLEMRKRVR